jgi:hypothetical protein
MSCCICGPVKNCATYLKKVFENIEKIGALFDDYQIILYYDHSWDNTLEILQQYQKKNPRLYFYINNSILSPFRTHNIAKARNFCLQYIRENSEKFPYFIMMDMDDVNATEHINTAPLKNALLRDDWDGLSFNTYPGYYDIWGLSIYPFCFSYNHFLSNYKYHNIIRNYINNMLATIPKGKLLSCISSFNGLAIYRTNKFLNSQYDGRVRSDLFPKALIDAHLKAQKSKTMVFPNYGHINALYEDCEHRAFHQQARIKSNARIMISPEILFY